MWNLEMLVERKKAVRAIYVHNECEKFVITFWMMRSFSHFLGA